MNRRVSLTQICTTSIKGIARECRIMHTSEHNFPEHAMGRGLRNYICTPEQLSEKIIYIKMVFGSSPY